ncbi:hypothetical protein GCM10023206_07320 [Acinetobacter puyangensis]|uniref:Uncharacterized protein n=1 Tax=Acinetobacter puyangensis TaxID=1096779 RepID=A0A240E603_9GAMM|nr:hypothetical protein [Acinetobacter puyangensis]SNX44188.1 hypothetical protein SAMN05421731_102349 [Acinetobacter puyangensis]
MTNLTEHKSAGKCPEYRDEQCKHCLIDHSVQQHEMITDSPLDRIEACYIQKKKQVELLQTEVTRLNDKIMQLEDENARLQKIIALHHESAIQEAERVQEIHALFVENL